MRWKSFHRGQNLTDLALIIGVVGLVCAGMQVYIKRSVQGKVKNLTDYILSDRQADDSTRISTTHLNAHSIRVGVTRLTGTEDSTTNYK